MYEGKNFYTFKQSAHRCIAKIAKTIFSTNVVFWPRVQKFLQIPKKKSENFPEFFHFLTQISWLCDSKRGGFLLRDLLCMGFVFHGHFDWHSLFLMWWTFLLVDGHFVNRWTLKIVDRWTFLLVDGHLYLLVKAKTPKKHTKNQCWQQKIIVENKCFTSAILIVGNYIGTKKKNELFWSTKQILQLDWILLESFWFSTFFHRTNIFFLQLLQTARGQNEKCVWLWSIQERLFCFE